MDTIGRRRQADHAYRKRRDLERASLGYPHELWTTRLLTRRIREHGPKAGHACLATLAQGTLCKILAAHAVKPHKVRYYLERRDPDFDAKMAEVLRVYREVELLKSAREQAVDAPAVPVVSNDEKPGVQAMHRAVVGAAIGSFSASAGGCAATWSGVGETRRVGALNGIVTLAKNRPLSVDFAPTSSVTGANSRARTCTIFNSQLRDVMISVTCGRRRSTFNLGCAVLPGNLPRLPSSAPSD